MEGNVGISGPPVIDVEIVVLAGGHVDRDARRHERNGAIPFVDAPEEFVSKVDVIQVVEAVGDIGLPQLPVQILGTPGRAVVLLVAFDGIVVYESRKCVPGGLGDLAVIDSEELVADDDAAAPVEGAVYRFRVRGIGLVKFDILHHRLILYPLIKY